MAAKNVYYVRIMNVTPVDKFEIRALTTIKTLSIGDNVYYNTGRHKVVNVWGNAVVIEPNPAGPKKQKLPCTGPKINIKLTAEDVLTLVSIGEVAVGIMEKENNTLSNLISCNLLREVLLKIDKQAEFKISDKDLEIIIKKIKGETSFD